MTGKLLGAAAAALVASSALAAGVTLTSKVFVERYVLAADGTMERKLLAPKSVVPGSNLVYVLTYRNGGKQPATNFAITNPVPREVEFLGGETPGWEVSVDGGRTYGPLASLMVRSNDGSARPARTGDVTHVRWRLANTIPPGASGEVAFKGRLK